MEQELTRKEIVIIAAPMGGVDKIHFTESTLRGSYTHMLDLWFPVHESIFKTAELLLQGCGMALNVVSIEEIRQCGPSKDYKVTYNEMPIE